ncbi:MAG: SpoIID/LytB domain-containing protein [Acidimicrobiales bacterium]
MLTIAPVISARAAVPVLVLDGTGYGHGVGLSQWGAEYLARTGRTASEILATFYPGTSLGQATGTVRVTVGQPASPIATVSFPQGGEVRSPRQGAQAAGFPVRVRPGGKVRITFDGSYRVEALVSGRSTQRATRYQQAPCALPLLCAPPTTPRSTTTTTPLEPEQPGGGNPDPDGAGDGEGGAAPGASTASSSKPVWALPAEAGLIGIDERGRSYRGIVEATGGADLRLVNELGIEDYLRGMAEVPGTWPPAAVEAQTIAARTYALRAMQAGGELCDDARCQVYAGQTAESPGEDAAVLSTAGTVLSFRGALASAVYSADAGGVSATTAEGFGTPDGVYPYLTTVRYETDNPLPWHLDVALRDVGLRLGYRGTLTAVRVGSTGPSGRALDLVLTGSSGDLHVDGRTFARSLGLRSTRFTATLGTADGAPPPPPPGDEALQELPEDVAALARRPLSMAMREREQAGPWIATAQRGTPDPLRSGRGLPLLAALLLVATLTGAHVPFVLVRQLHSRQR